MGWRELVFEQGGGILPALFDLNIHLQGIPPFYLYSDEVNYFAASITYGTLETNLVWVIQIQLFESISSPLQP